jgi:hypothetical protein
LKQWRSLGGDVTTRLRKLLQGIIKADSTPQQRLAALLDELQLNELETAFQFALDEVQMAFVVLVDRLDEGYEPTDAGVGLVDGIVNATIEINTRFAAIRAILFVRDNMFRTIAKRNRDFSKNIEGQALRLHWNDYHLMNMVAQRMRIAFEIEQEQSLKVWNRFVARELQGWDGFRHCLQLTLYRPRDILVLLNEAFCNANRENRRELIPSDVATAGKVISGNRLDDLHKEYSAVIPGIEYLTNTFMNQQPELSVEDAQRIIDPVLKSPTYTTQVIQEFEILGESIEVLRALYGIGFVGILDDHGRFVFCHDGNHPDKGLSGNESLLVHPCYWMALNMTRDPLSPSQAEEIHDDHDDSDKDSREKYDISVEDSTIQQRAQKLEQHTSQIGKIPIGSVGQVGFEEWCRRSIQTVFAGALGDIDFGERNPQSGARTLLATNYGRTETWKRTTASFDCRRAAFCICNKDDVPKAAYDEAARNIGNAGSRLVFLITREERIENFKHGELAWIREIAEQKRVMVLRLTANYFVTMLHKLRNPQKHDAADVSLNGLLTMYLNNYVRPLTDKLMAAADDDADQPVVVTAPPAECYGELGIDESTGKPKLAIYRRHLAGGAQSPACDSIELKNQAYHLLEAGCRQAREFHISAKRESSRLAGQQCDPSECEPAAEQTFELVWTQDDLAKLVCNKDRFADIKKAEKEQIKSAVSRLRRLVHFEPDNCGLVTEAENRRRRSVIRLRLAKS